MPGVFSDYAAPLILRGEDGEREMRDIRWGIGDHPRAPSLPAAAS
jgi:hypothetical protein